MAFYNENTVLTSNGIILWNGITNPERKEDNLLSYSVKIAIPANSVEKTELEQLAQKALTESADFKGKLPNGGNWPVMDIDLTKFQADAARLAGHVAINAKTGHAPKVYDQNGQKLDPMQYGQLLYAGAKVKLLVRAYAFNNKSKGIAYSLEGLQIVDATAPALAVGGGMSESEVAGAFGAAPTAAPSAVTPPPPPAPHTEFVNGPKSRLLNGVPYTEAQLEAAGYTQAMIEALPVA